MVRENTTGLLATPLFALFKPQACQTSPAQPLKSKMMRAIDGMTAFRLSSPSGMCAASSWIKSDGVKAKALRQNQDPYPTGAPTPHPLPPKILNSLA